MVYINRDGAAKWSKGWLRFRHPGFNSALGVHIDYLIHGSGEWGGRVSTVYVTKVGLKGLALVRFNAPVVLSLPIDHPI